MSKKKKLPTKAQILAAFAKLSIVDQVDITSDLDLVYDDFREMLDAARGAELRDLAEDVLRRASTTAR